MDYQHSNDSGYFTDDGRTSAVIAGLKSKSYGILDSNILDRGLSKIVKSTVYVYLGASNRWGSLADTETQRQLCDLVNATNVTVNYLGAMSPFVKYITMRSEKIGSIPMSICMGTHRLSISYAGDEMQLTVVQGVASVESGTDMRVTGFCVMPCNFFHFPLTWQPSTGLSLLLYLSALFVDETEMETLLWVIGLSLVDPCPASKFLLLYGPGGTGKSNIVSTIPTIAPGCTGVILASQLTSPKYTELTRDTCETISSNRLATTNELDISKDGLNTHVIKQMTGHDSVYVAPIQVDTRCTIVSSSNSLPDPLRGTEWTTTAIARRTIVLPMNVNAMELPKVERPDSDRDCMDAMLACVNMYATNDSMPMSTRSCLYSVMGKVYETLRDVIVVDPDSTMTQVIDANVHIAAVLDVPVSELGILAHLRSASVTVRYGDTLYISCVRMSH